MAGKVTARRVADLCRLRRARTESVDPGKLDSLDYSARLDEVPPSWVECLLDMGEALHERLTPRQRMHYRVLRDSPTMSEAARACRCAPRDLRASLLAIARIARRLLAQRSR